MRSADYVAFYAEHFHTVEVDSTFYGCPTPRTVANSAARTPEGFTTDWTYIRWLGDRKGIPVETSTRIAKKHPQMTRR